MSGSGKLRQGGPFFSHRRSPGSAVRTPSRSNLTLEAIGPLGSNCFSSEVRTSVSKETYWRL